MSLNQSAANFDPVNTINHINVRKASNGALFFAPECRFPLSCFVSFEELIVAQNEYTYYIATAQPYASLLICHAYLSTHNCSSHDTNTRPVQINDLRFICDTAAKAVCEAPLLYSPRRVCDNNGHGIMRARI